MQFRTVNLSHSNLTWLDEDSIPDDVELLNLSYNKLYQLPEFITKLKHLKVLILNNNKIFKLPENIGELKQLFYVDVSYNSLTNLPTSFCNLQELTYLNVEGNDISLTTCDKEVFDFIVDKVIKCRSNDT